MSIENGKACILQAPIHEREKAFGCWYEASLASLPPKTQEFVREYVPQNPLRQHAQFNREQEYPSFHNENHVLGATAVAMSYIANSEPDNDPLQLWDGVRAIEEQLNANSLTKGANYEFTHEEILLGVGVGFGYHDICEIAVGFESRLDGFPRLLTRNDGYRARRKLDGYDVPELMSADAAAAHAMNMDRDVDSRLKIATLAHHVAMETTWCPTGNPLGYFVRYCDRLSGVMNPDDLKDVGAVCEIAASNPSANVNLHTEFNFHQTMVHEVLPDGVSTGEVLNIIFDGCVPDDVMEIDDFYAELLRLDTNVPASFAAERLYREARSPYDPRFVGINRKRTAPAASM